MTGTDLAIESAAQQWSWLQRELLALTHRIQATLRAGHPANSPITHLGWTVAQLAAHMVSVPRIYRGVVTEPESFVVPASMAAFGESELSQTGTLDLHELADLLESEVRQLLAVLGPDGTRPVPFYSMVHKASGVGGVLLNELLMHHRDLGRALGEPVPISNDHVLMMMRGMMPATTIFFDRRIALRTEGIVHIHLRGGDDWTIEVANGKVAVAMERPRKADIHINADPVVFVLAAFGRESQILAGARGKIVVYGRKPWLLPRLTKLFVEELSLSGLSY